MPDVLLSSVGFAFLDFAIFSSLESTPSFNAFFLVDVVLACDFLPATSGIDVFCVVDLNLVDGRMAVVGGAGLM